MMLLDDAARNVVLPKWGKAEDHFEIPDRLGRRFPMLRTPPVRAAKADTSGEVYRVPKTHDSVVGAYPNALLIGSPSGRAARRYWAWFALALSVCSLALFTSALGSRVSRLIEYPSAVNMVGSAILIVALVFIFLFLLWCTNVMRKSPADWPIMFNRATREVAYFEVKFPHFFKFWKSPRESIVVRPWADAHFRIYKATQFTGGGLKNIFELALLWGDETNSKLLKYVVLLGDNFSFGDEPCLQIWEHIRRYMDEDGPVLNAGEALRKPSNNNPPLRFPRALQESAGGAMLSDEEIEALAGK